MKYALYLGCTAQAEQFGYEASVRAVLPSFGVELADMHGTSCCGYPSHSSVNFQAWLYLSARNMAIAEQMGLTLFPLCNGCHLSFVETKHTLGENLELKKKINDVLRNEDLVYTGDVKLIHILELLHDVIGKEAVQKAVKNKLTGLKLAAHPGCHAIRPSRLGRPDDSENPQKLDDLIRWLGAESMDYPEKIDCCGSSLAVTAGKAVMEIAGDKLMAIKKYGFDGLVTTCPFCFKIFDNRQKAIQATLGEKSLEVPIFYYPQLLGAAMGISEEKLGLELNQSQVDSVISRVYGGK
jgi:heterodisulfide reductase subunit B